MAATLLKKPPKLMPSHPWALAMTRAGGCCEVQILVRGVLRRCGKRALNVAREGMRTFVICGPCRHAQRLYTDDERARFGREDEDRQAELFGGSK